MTLILRARNEDGSLMFHKNSRMEFRTFVDPEVIANVVLAMNDDFVISDEDIEKN